MQNPAPPLNYAWPQRPRLSEFRPHTVHASSSTTHPIEEERLVKGVQEDEDSDDQSTPRASLAGLTILPDRRLSRDDTATDFHHAIAASHSRPVEPKEDPLSAFGNISSKHQSEGFRSQRRFRRAPNALHSAAPASDSDTAGNPLRSISLGRRFSRNIERVMELKDTVAKHTGMRRSSVVQPSDARCINPTVVAPVSPSKRGSKNDNSRPKKLRAGLGLALNDRKDTPAPPAYGLPSRLPLQSSPWQVQGGDGARKSAAAYNTSAPLWDDENWTNEFRDLQNTRRRRVGSLSSAADSGADLSSYGGSQYQDVDVDGDIDMEQAEEQTPSRPAARDFVEKLPSEISLQIFEYLDAHDLLTAQCMTSSWNMLANEASVWRAAYLRKYNREVFTDPAPVQVGGPGIGRTNKPNQEWKRMYKSRVELEKNWRKGADEAGKAVYLSGHTDSVYCVQFDEEKIITGSRDRTIRVWDINTFQCLRVIGGPTVRPTLGPKTLRTVDYPAFHLATASVNGTAYGDGIYHVPSQWHDASILCLQYDSEILVTGSSDSDLIVWDINTYEPIRRLHKHTGGVLDVALDAKHIVSCSKDSRIIVWDRETYEPIGDLTGHRGPVNAVQLRGHLLVSASGDGIARLWDLNTMKLVKEFSAKERGLAAVEFSEDMKYVLAGGNDHITYKFDVATGKEVQQFTGHSQLVRSLWLDSANSRVVSGSYDLDLRVYDFNTGEEIWRAEEWTTSWMLAAKSDYRRIVATSQDGRILLVDFGLVKGGRTDGERIKDVELLRGIEHTSAVCWRNPWTQEPI